MIGTFKKIKTPKWEKVDKKMKMQDVLNLYQEVKRFNLIIKECDSMLDALYYDQGHGYFVDQHDPDKDSIAEEYSQKIDKYEDMRKEHTIENIFGDVHDRLLIEQLISLVEKEVDYDEINGFDSLFVSTTCKIIELLCANKAQLANVPLDGRSLELLFKIGKYIDRNLICLDYEGGRFIYHIDINSEIQRFVCENKNNDSFDALYRWFVLRNVTIDSAVTAYGNIRICKFAQ